MKIQVMSDIHFEFHRDGGASFLASLPEPQAEVLVLAGDIVPVMEPFLAGFVLEWFASKWAHVLYVPGNHEYYGGDARKLETELQQNMSDFPNLHLLYEGQLPVIDGQRFVGHTMWFDAVRNPKWKHAMNDFRFIQNFEPWVYELHNTAKEWFDAIVSKEDIVVTHHMPSMKSVPKRYKNSPLNPFFVSDMEALIEERQPRLWIHGHTHGASDYKIGETRIVCNPLGYPGEESGFREDFVVEI